MRSVSISIHAPVKGATAVCKDHAMVQPDFNPRTREGCDPNITIIFTEFTHISIHAPVKGATCAVSVVIASSPISIHAPVKGATPPLRETNGAILRISIHAPVKGATYKEYNKVFI